MTDKPVTASEAARQGATPLPSLLPECIQGKIGCSPEPAIQGVRISINSSYGRTEITMDRDQAQAHCAHVQACLAATAATSTNPVAAAALAIDRAREAKS
jgi:hypothetical protein